MEQDPVTRLEVNLKREVRSVNGDRDQGELGVIVLAVIMIGSQTIKAARRNPAEVLKSE